MIASLKGYSRIARILLGILGVLLIGGIIGSILMGVRAKQTAQDVVVSQARIHRRQFAVARVRAGDLSAPVGTVRAAELTEQIQRVVVYPSHFDSVTVYSPEGTILYSNEQVGSATRSRAPRTRSATCSDGRAVLRPYQGDTVSVMLPLRFQSGVGEPGRRRAPRLRSRPIATAADRPWNTNAMFLFGLLVRAWVSWSSASPACSRPMKSGREKAGGPPVQSRCPSRRPRRAYRQTPQPGLREEGEARRRGRGPRRCRRGPAHAAAGSVPQIARGAAGVTAPK